MGLGAVAGVPLSQRDALNNGKYTLGPSAVAIYTPKDFVIGGLLNYSWSVSGSDKREDVSQMSFQYFVDWMGLPDHWQLNMSPTVTYDAKADGPDAWAVPIGIGIGKMVKIGGLPIKLQVEYESYLARPDDFGPRHAIFFKITPAIPRLIKEPLF